MSDKQKGYENMSRLSGNEIIKGVLKLDEEWKTEWNRLADEKAAVILVGAGVTSEFILHEFTSRGIVPVCFCDNDKKKQGKKIAGLDVWSVADAVYKYNDGIFYITTQLYYTQIKRQLLDMGVAADRIVQYDLVCQFTWEKDYRKYIETHQNELAELIDMMSDEISKEVVAARLGFLITRKRDYVCCIRGRIQYFDAEFINYKNINTFVDVGMYIGDSVLEFEKHCNMEECVIYGFELDNELYRCAQENLKHLAGKITFIKKAVADKDGKVNIVSGLGSMQSITDVYTIQGGGYQEQDCITVDAVRLDSVLTEECNNTFIKMDIEGAEMSALLGAENFIKKNHPLLAVCVYHKAEDILDIPKFIKRCYSGYGFYMRHYSDNQTETVLYAVPDLKNSI